ncbi:MAG: CerR family C-terminal domain-containing protein [Rhizobiaceae bacterium]|nr:CerR family C-terminal domain-containing protein [Rhizobiaceae bacterium]MCV0406060.1 CerR family C-terminal domain-containing protein [Rhizobiaceae bacterium]
MTDSRQPSPPIPSNADVTRLALIRAALKLFGSKGFEATSTREIATAARANIGSIAYHFGGKEGLREACAHHVVETIRTVAGPAMRIAPEDLPPDEAETLLTTAIERMVSLVVASPEAGEFVPFMLREVMQPSSALDIVYEGVFEPVHTRFCQLWERATGEPAESERTRVTIFSLIGQVLYFRIGRVAVLRRMGWDAIDEGRARLIAEIATGNARAILKARRDKGR